ncbi:BON domain-containing protein [Gilvimarinus polysaccharolyticus]|uniref:BON domain-containing protein n=1 Tax=Gilvimarinus polysaccharolyticus TaxID=863921 RepID=UPI0006736159|nr:BON domain-containing protein [Gilvimarinus polysaccharolyticus]
MHSPNTNSFIQMIVPVTSAALVTAFSVSTAIGANTKSPYADKPSPAEFWQAFSQDQGQSWESDQAAYRDGWLEGRLSAVLALNEHLNPFNISATVSSSTATLTGAVAHQIDKELATNIVMGIDGIAEVDNKITIDEEQVDNENREPGRNFVEYISDMSTTAAIKTELLSSSNIDAIGINVDTHLNEVTLSGSVVHEAQSKLAEAIVTKHPDIARVHNHLTIEH